ncbi:hypothetical protein HID58_053970 [Brassica napus]|uniref:Uncharacterized protein n=1 Tax=Brassica napus TaxID=3708 RepID=A0ABQ8AG93_BRANA|nr:hypothetical protein HID58_053970 [Brassica napus]
MKLKTVHLCHKPFHRLKVINKWSTMLVPLLMLQICLLASRLYFLVLALKPEVVQMNSELRLYINIPQQPNSSANINNSMTISVLLV